jgi:hypothetical protein
VSSKHTANTAYRGLMFLKCLYQIAAIVFNLTRNMHMLAWCSSHGLTAYTQCDKGWRAHHLVECRWRQALKRSDDFFRDKLVPATLCNNIAPCRAFWACAVTKPRCLPSKGRQGLLKCNTNTQLGTLNSRLCLWTTLGLNPKHSPNEIPPPHSTTYKSTVCPRQGPLVKTENPLA